MSDFLRVLVVEDNPGDAELLVELLPRDDGTLLDVRCVVRLSAALECVAAERFDIVLLDLGLPDSDGLATLRTMQRHAANLPIVVLTGNNDEAAGLDAIREGAQDYLIKGQAGKNQLARSIKYAVERKQAENTIKELNDTLEERILERTAQISLANEALRGEITERKRMEEMLRESERCEHERAEELAVLLEAVPTPVFIASDPDCLHLTGNRLANEILRISCGNELTLSGHRETSPRHFRYFKDGRELRHDELPAHRAASGVPVKDFEFTLVFDDGMVRPVLGYGTPLLDNKGCPRGMVAVLVDITERKQVEEALRQSEENYRELFNTLIEGFCIIEVLFDTNDRPIDYRLLKMNPAFEVQTGLHDAQGKLMRELAPEYEAHWFEILGNVALTGESIRFVNETNAPNRWYDVSAYRVGVQESRKVAILFNDITEVKKAEIALKASEERLALALDGGRMGMWEWDTRLHRAVWNALEYQLLGLPVGEGDVALHLFFGLVHPDDIGPFNEILANVMEYGSDFNHEIRITRADDGQERWLATAGRLIRDAAGQPLKIIGVNYDITERKQAEEALKKFNEELEKQVAERTMELAANIVKLNVEIVERKKAEKSVLRLNRLYKVVSETSQAIIRTMDRESIFNEFCRIAVEDGKFKLAWVGLVDEEIGDLRIVASQGATGYLDGIQITVNEGPGSLGPTGITVREGTYCICNDFLGSPITRPWRERGRAHGIRASASIAMKHEGQVIGALTLYADKKDFFDQQQIELLQQMGADVSFALDNIVRETHRKEVERSLREETSERLLAMESLREKDQMLIQQSRQAAMGEMINNIAHQWRQPLNTLALAIQEQKMMFDFGECTEEFMKRSVEKSMGIIQHMSQTIDDFRNYFKPDKEKTEFKLPEVVANTLSLVEDSFKYQRVEIDIVTLHSPLIFGYRNEYAQALLNILNNAKDALTEREIEHPRVAITMSSEGGRAVITIADNAGGIPEEILGKIFDPYFTTKGPQAGTGLGLFMSKAIIEKNLGGSLTVRNARAGAEFRIEV